MNDFETQLKNDLLPWLLERFEGDERWDTALTAANYYLPSRQNADYRHRRNLFIWRMSALSEFHTTYEDPPAEFELLISEYCELNTLRDQAGAARAATRLLDFITELMDVAEDEKPLEPPMPVENAPEAA